MSELERREPACRWELHRRDLGTFKALLQSGVAVRARTGTSVRAFLVDSLGVDPEYVESEIQTVFLDSHPVDNLDAAHVVDGCTLALSGAMPGLAGATMRRGGYYARMRAGISLDARPDSVGGADSGIIRVKLFNRPLGDLTEAMTGRSLGFPRTALSHPRLQPLISDSALAGDDALIWLDVRLVD